jgi:hypothetical protein
VNILKSLDIGKKPLFFFVCANPIPDGNLVDDAGSGERKRTPS